MNNKILRLAFLILQSVFTLVGIGCCVYGLVMTEFININDPYLTTAIRLIVIFVATVTYYKSSSTIVNQSGIFMMLSLFLVNIAELRIIHDFAVLSGMLFMPGRVFVRFMIFLQCMIHVSLIGYGIYYQTNEYISINRYALLGTAASIFIAVMVPASQDLGTLWTMTAPFIVLNSLALVTVVTHMILAFSEPTSMGTLRHLSTVLMVIGNYLVVAYANPFITIVGTGLFTIGGILAVIITLRTTVIL